MEPKQWYVAFDWDELDGMFILDNKGEPVAVIAEDNFGQPGDVVKYDPEVVKARAELIADAPDLLRLLKYCAEYAWRYFDCSDVSDPLELVESYALLEKHAGLLGAKHEG